jgi:hypothetical protein
VAGIPAFPDFCGVELSHREEVAGVLGRMSRPISEWTFTNLYLFRKAHEYLLSRYDGLLLVVGRGYDGAAYAFAPWGEGPVEEAARALCRKLSDEGHAPVLFPVPREMFENRFTPGTWEADTDRDQADYVYRRSDLAELPGKTYHKRRNRLAKFFREEGATYEYAEFSDAHAEDCLALARGWCDERCSVDRMSTYRETEAALDALTCRKELGLVGGVALLGGEVAAFCLGEPLDQETFVVHFEKSRPGVEGLAQAINRDFCLHTIAGFHWVNREQDLGDPGLRHAKESYYPAFLAEKLRLRPLGQGA